MKGGKKMDHSSLQIKYMENQGKETKMKKTRDLTTRPETTPSIPEDVVQDIIELSDDTCLWTRIKTGGFQFPNQNEIVPELVGRIVAMDRYLVNFPGPGQAPIKKPWVKSDVDIPEGFSKRVDIKMNIDGQFIGLSLAHSSAKYQLSPYITYLTNQGRRPEDVITRVTTRQASNNLGTWDVAVFSLVDEVGEKEKPPEPPKPAAPNQETIPAEWK